jgi:hypothetical protein
LYAGVASAEITFSGIAEELSTEVGVSSEIKKARPASVMPICAIDKYETRLKDIEAGRECG